MFKNGYQFLDKGGEMGELTRLYNWSSSPLGTPEHWPQSLKTTLSIILNSKFPMFLFWGPQHICFYNDAYRPSLGNNGKHPAMLGMPGADAWAEIWPFIKPLIDQVLAGGEASWNEDQLLPIYRNGQLEDVYWTFSYSPVVDESGEVAGVFVTCSETTGIVIATRQLEENNRQLILAVEAEKLAQRQVKENERNLQLILTQAPVAIGIFRGPDYMVEIANGRALELWGRKLEDVLGRPILEAMPELETQGIEQLLNSVYTTGKPFTAAELPVEIQRNGKPTVAYINFLYEPLHDADGVINGLITIGFEVTEQVLNRKNTEESEERFRVMAEGTDVLIAVGDESSNATYFNKAWVNLTGRLSALLLEFGWVDLVHPDDRERYVNIYLSAFKDKVPFTGEFRVLSTAGEYRSLLVKGQPRFRQDGSFAGYISSCVDITERAAAEEEKLRLLISVKANEQKLDQILNLLPAHVLVITGKELIVEQANASVFPFWKKTSSEVIGQPLLKILPAMVNQPFPKQLLYVMETGETLEFKESLAIFEEPDGSKRNTYVDYSYQPLTGENGMINGVLVLSFEVTDKVETRLLLEKLADDLQTINEVAATSNEELASTNEELSSTNEELSAVNEELAATNEELAETQNSLQGMVDNLAKSDARFRFLVRGAPIAIGVLNGRDLIIESANDMILNIWGKTNDILGLPLSVALPELQGQPFLQLLDNVYTSGEAYYGYETPVILEHGGELLQSFFNFIYEPLSNEDGGDNTIMVVAVEVTDLLLARREREKAEEQLLMAVEAAGIGSWHIDPETKDLHYNQTLAKLFGYEGTANMTYAQAIGQITEDYRWKIEKEIEAAIAKGDDYDITYTQRRFNDGEVIWLRSVGKLRRDEHDDLAVFSGVVMDVTEIKKDELRKNDFIGMVSHELKTPLTSLSAYIQMLVVRSNKNADAFTASALDKVNIQVRKMSDMINSFLNISRLESGKIYLAIEAFDLSALVAEVIEDTMVSVATHRITFTQVDSIQINADRDKIGSVISNLLSNAVKYSPKGKLIEVSCEIVGHDALVSVKDEGMGVKPQDQSKLFDRYYRVESKNTQHISGFGIGLYLSAEIIDRHKGKIGLESKSGVGSTFYFTLPLPG